MLTEQKIRAFLFYLSVFIFFIGLPFILSGALGYKFDRRTFKFAKTGLIALKTQPSGASVYFNNKLLEDKTPLTINELLPGTYHLEMKLKKYYSWSGEVKVEAGKVTRLEKIILFPIRPNIKQINTEKFYSFWLDGEKETIYYASLEDNGIYKSDLKGDNYERIATFLQLSPPPTQFILSPDRTKIAYFNKYKIALTYLESFTERPLLESDFILDYSGDSITHVFWHSDSYHLVLVSDANIEVLEAKDKSKPILVVRLSKKNTPVFYDIASDTLYFIDSQRAADGNVYDNLYKLELNTRAFPFQQLIKLKTSG